MAYDPSIEGHIDLETRSSWSIEVDHAAGSIGFLAKDKDYLHTEHLYAHILSLLGHSTHFMASVPLGHSEPKTKLKLITGAQHSTALSGKVGLAGGKPTIIISPTATKSTSTTTEVADEEVYLRVLGSRGFLITHAPYARSQSSGLFLFNGSTVTGKARCLVIVE